MSPYFTYLRLALSQVSDVFCKKTTYRMGESQIIENNIISGSKSGGTPVRQKQAVKKETSQLTPSVDLDAEPQTWAVSDQQDMETSEQDLDIRILSTG